jgi:hypothetical protein
MREIFGHGGKLIPVWPVVAGFVTIGAAPNGDRAAGNRLFARIEVRRFRKVSRAARLVRSAVRAIRALRG